MFEASFFDRHSLTNYQLFRAMKTLPQTTLSINALSRATGLSYSQTYTAFQTVLVQLNQMIPAETIDEANFAQFLGNVTIIGLRYLKKVCRLSSLMMCLKTRTLIFTHLKRYIKPASPP